MSWFIEHKQLAIQNIILCKECKKLRSDILGLEERNWYNLQKSSTCSTKRIIRRDKICGDVGYDKHAAQAPSFSSHQSTFNYLPIQEIKKKIDALRKNCHDAKSAMIRLKDLEKVENAEFHPTKRASILRKTRNQCQIVIQSYERQYDLLQETLSKESIRLEEQRRRLEKAIVELVDWILM